MAKIEISESDDAPVIPTYAQAVRLTDFNEILFISGQIPQERDGTVPEGFEGQCRLVWANIDRQLTAAGMTRDNLVHVRIYLSDAADVATYRKVRDEYLEGRRIGLTTIYCRIFAPEWLLEIEATAAI